MIRLQRVTPDQRQLLFNLNQKYLYEMTNYYDDPLDERGNLHYGHFDEYFTDPARTALLIYDGDALAGFAMLNPCSYFGGTVDHVMAEFTIFPMYRRRHLATGAAEAIFERWPGRWEVKFNEKNAEARSLWTRVTARYAPTVRRLSDEETVLCFEVA
ncbi:MAG: GNAT family N-acetyltransferase [Clostridia bacterium]|nr:GNAT family N-acetyltransferase [Clostridia bacterium]MBQ6325342.1 GNAT family N-acetyltransferase [Clostridia bacterium]